MTHDAEFFVAFALAATAAAVAVTLVSPGNAYAESTAEYTTTFVSTRSRADAQAELMATRTPEVRLQRVGDAEQRADCAQER